MSHNVTIRFVSAHTTQIASNLLFIGISASFNSHMLYIQSDLPPLHQSRDIVSPTLPALSPRYGSGRGSGRGDRTAGNRDNPSATATQAHAGSAFGKGCVYRQGDHTRQDRLRNRPRCSCRSILSIYLTILLLSVQKYYLLYIT